MTKLKVKSFVIPLLVLALLSQPTLTLADSQTLKVIQGNTPVETAINVAKELNSQSNTYVIATTSDYPDAMAGTVLAGKYKAPILFVTNGDNQAVFDYLKSKNVNSQTQFYILGETGAVSPTVENQLKAISTKVTRLGGVDRYGTVDAINTYLNPKYNTPVIIATGLNYPDALSMGAISGQYQYPIYLINENEIPQSVALQLRKINPGYVYIAGGTGVVPQALESQIRELAPASTLVRLGGLDRYETSQKIADWFRDKLPEKIYTTGEDFHSALVSAPLATQQKASILLADNITPDQQTTMNQQMGYQVGNIAVATPSQQQGTTVLTEADIQRLQSYPQSYGNSSSSAYHSFEDMYTNNRASCDALLERFSPNTLSEFNNAKVEWLTSPRLVYRNAISQYCIRGIVKVTFSGNNQFNLIPNITYQRDVEYRLRSTDQLRLENTNYLSEFQALNQ